jgi:hypothetical protein
MKIDGKFNEKNIALAINKKLIKDIKSNISDSILKIIFPRIDSKEFFYATAIGDSKMKPDIKISYKNKVKYLSVKSGSGCSVHQESTNEFIDFLKNTTGISRDIEDCIKFYVWGDGTYDGSGISTNRMNANQLKCKFPEILDKIQNFFDNNKELLINRFIKIGKDNSYVPVDYIYYGGVERGSIKDIDECIKYLVNTKKNTLSIGGLTFQAWGRAIPTRRNPKPSKRNRGIIQVKWGCPSDFI